MRRTSRFTDEAAQPQRELEMRVYMIGYDLNRPGQNYGDLIEAIKKLSNGYWHWLDSTWIIGSELSAVAIRDSLMPYLDASDELLVARMASEVAWDGFDDDAANWLRQTFNSVAV